MRRERVESFFRPIGEGRSWPPVGVAVAGLVAVSLVARFVAEARLPGAGSTGVLTVAAYALVAFLLGWPRTVWAVVPVLAVESVAGFVMASRTAPLELYLASLGIGLLFTGVGAAGGTAWLWDRVRRGETDVRPLAWAGLLVGLILLVVGALAVAPGELEILPFVEFGTWQGGVTPLTLLVVGAGLSVAVAAGATRWSRAASFTFVDRFLVAGLAFGVSHVLLQHAAVAGVAVAANKGVLVQGGELSFLAEDTLWGVYHGFGEVLVGAVLASLVSLWLLPHRYRGPADEG